MKYCTVKTWKASAEDINILGNLADAGIERNESSRVRAGLKLLAKKHKIDERKVSDNGNSNIKT